MDNTYLDIVKRHLKDSYFADLFFSTKEYYQTNPLQPYEKENDFYDNYQPLENHSSYLAHCLHNIRLFFSFLSRIALSHSVLFIIIVLLIIWFISAYGDALHRMSDILSYIFIYEYGMPPHGIGAILGSHIGDILFILVPIILFLGSSLFTYLRDKKKN